MPDHLHVITSGKSIRADAKRAIDGFKQHSGALFAESNVEAGWQEDYFDHIIRDYEDRQKQVAYVFLNPVRAGLVRDGFDYPFTGSDYGFGESFQGT